VHVKEIRGGLAGVFQRHSLNISPHFVTLPTLQAEAKFVAEDMFIWGIHFNATGFAKMATSWHTAIQGSRPMQQAMQRLWH
jgi:hypothetical protein